MRLVAAGCSHLDLMNCWPPNEPLLALLGSGRYGVVATSFSEVAFAEVRKAGVSELSSARMDAPPLGTGVVGLVSYDASMPNRAFRVDQALVLDRHRQTLWLAGEGALSDHVAQLVHAAKGASSPVDAVSLRLLPQESDASYLAKAARVLEDIRSGRYYQLNLLRFFSVERAVLGRSWLLSRMASHGGDFAALIDLPDLSLASFSPERFVTVAGGIIETFPVKGTAARHSDACLDRAAAASLLASAKDRAELAMIVDLMRNDLSIVARPGSVSVPDPLLLSTHANVHHLSSRVRAELLPNTTLGDILDAVCPGGSITGAPKREVMTAIASFEGRSRGYFMGNLFYLSDAGYFDSSILIRTLIKSPQTGYYELAAGSGLVIGSDPALELAEIAAKARVVGAVTNSSVAKAAQNLGFEP